MTFDILYFRDKHNWNKSFLNLLQKFQYRSFFKIFYRNFLQNFFKKSFFFI